MLSADSRQRPYKVWSCDRQTRKAVMASNLRELRERGSSRLGVPGTDVKIVLESDGTEVEDDIYFQTVDRDTIFLIVCPGERWLPPGVEALRAAITAIPRIVCEAINSMDLKEKPPSWKIMDNKGKVTVVLHWDQREDMRHSSDSRDRPGDREAVWRVEVMSQNAQSAADTVTSVDGTVITIPRTKLTLEGLGPRPSTRVLPPQTSVECKGKETSPEHDHSLCDFHCSALHEKGAQIHVNKSVATSPIQEVPEGTATATIKKSTGKGHVRFSDVAEETKIPAQDESESDTENTANEEEQLSERYLLLVDQLSLEQNRHLSVKDLGIILERLSSKIVDVDRLERERESTDVHNWTIKATIRGEVLREIGVIYNGQYYGIMEHPGYF